MNKGNQGDNTCKVEQTLCEQCTYYFGKSSIHCAVHPHGKETDYCDDWQKVTLKQKIAMNIKSVANNISYPNAAAIVVCIASTITLGYGMKKHLPVAIDAVQEYQRYTQECRVFLERVGTAGTIGVAEPELVKVVSFLKTNRLTQSFEYKDLQANLAYLKSQPDNSLMPSVIKDSISKNTAAIEEAQTKKLNQDLKSLFSLEIAGSVMALTIAMLIIREENNN